MLDCFQYRNIVDTIFGDMLFHPVENFDNDDDDDLEDHVFGREADLNVVMCLRFKVVATAKSRAVALFKRFQSKTDDDVNDEA
jgi:hypothetical protein